jgi:DNA (cytosine-5)-methyltransferase 1
MKYFSTFTGIGGFELGLMQAYEIRMGTADRNANGKSKRNPSGFNEKGARLVSSTRQSVSAANRWAGKHVKHRNDEGQPHCVGYSEIDSYATKIYQSHYSTHKNYGDITKISEKELPDFDFFFGGFPCQSFSIAGKRGGFTDTRGTLFFDICRILRAKQPRLVLLENVKGLLSHDEGRTIRTIIAALNDVGYDLQWQVLNSKDFGVPQNRERIFIIGHLRGTRRPQVFPFEEASSNGAGPDAAEKEILASTLTARQFANWNGNYVRQVAQINKGQSGRIYGTDGISPTLSTMAGGGLKQPKILHFPIENSTGRIGGWRESDKRISAYRNDKRKSTLQETVIHKLNDHSGALNTAHTPRVLTGGVRRLTPVECERLQGFPDGWTEGVSDTQRYKCLGNAVTVNVIRAICGKLFYE